MTAPEQNKTKEKSPHRWGEKFIEIIIRLAGVSTIVIVGLIFLFLLKEGLPAFLDIPLRQLFGSRWYPIEGLYGIAPPGGFADGHLGRRHHCRSFGPGRCDHLVNSHRHGCGKYSSR